MIKVAIEVPNSGAIATAADIVDNHTDVVNMKMDISVGLFNDAGDRLHTIVVEHKITQFPIPSIEEQWDIVMPTITSYQAAHPAPQV